MLCCCHPGLIRRGLWLLLQLGDQYFLGGAIEERCIVLSMEWAFVRPDGRVALLHARYGDSASNGIKAHISLRDLSDQHTSLDDARGQ